MKSSAALAPSASSASLGGPSTFPLEDPLRVSRTLGLVASRPGITSIVEARFPPTNWGVLTTKPYRPSLRSALEGMNQDDMVSAGGGLALEGTRDGARAGTLPGRAATGSESGSGSGSESGSESDSDSGSDSASG